MTSAAAQSQALWGENLRLCMFSCVFFAVCVCVRILYVCMRERQIWQMRKGHRDQQRFILQGSWDHIVVKLADPRCFSV